MVTALFVDGADQLSDEVLGEAADEERDLGYRGGEVGGVRCMVGGLGPDLLGAWQQRRAPRDRNA